MCRSSTGRGQGNHGRFSIRGVIGAVFVSLAIALCIHVFFQQWSPILESWRAVDAWTLLLAGVLGTLGLAIVPLCICELYRGLEPRTFRPAGLCCAYFIANIFRYVPGKVVTIAALLESSGNQGLSRTKVFQAFVACFGLSIAISLGLTAAFMLPLVSTSPAVLAASWILALGVLVTFQPHANAFLIRTGLRVLRRPDVEVRSFRLTTLIRAFFLMILAWAALGLSFALIVKDVAELSAAGMLFCALAYPAAYTAGVLALVAPAGVGVREGLLVAFLAQVFPSQFSGAEGAAVALSVVIAHRAVITLVDLFLLAVGLTGSNLVRRRSREAES